MQFINRPHRILPNHICHRNQSDKFSVVHERKRRFSLCGKVICLFLHLLWNRRLFSDDRKTSANQFFLLASRRKSVPRERRKIGNFLC